MMKEQTGFTLLELCMCLILLGIFLESISDFYGRCCHGYQVFYEQLMLEHEGENIEAFIQSSIRKANKVKVTTQEGSSIEEVRNSNELGEKVEGENLKKIKCASIVFINGLEKEETYCIELVDNHGKGAGKYALVYEGAGGKTRNVISDQIESIQITKDKQSNIIEFQCLLHKEKNESSKRITFSQRFSVSLAHKLAI